jgi:hypothetical protein
LQHVETLETLSAVKKVTWAVPFHVIRRIAHYGALGSSKKGNYKQNPKVIGARFNKVLEQ